MTVSCYDCRKTKTKAITPTNHNRSKQRDEFLAITCNSLKAREKSRVRARGAIGFDSHALVEKLARVF